jgi:hypothetical protein
MAFGRYWREVSGPVRSPFSLSTKLCFAQARRNLLVHVCLIAAHSMLPNARLLCPCPHLPLSSAFPPPMLATANPSPSKQRQRTLLPPRRRHRMLPDAKALQLERPICLVRNRLRRNRRFERAGLDCGCREFYLYDCEVIGLGAERGRKWGKGRGRRWEYKESRWSVSCCFFFFLSREGIVDSGGLFTGMMELGSHGEWW